MGKRVQILLWIAALVAVSACGGEGESGGKPTATVDSGGGAGDIAGEVAGDGEADAVEPDASTDSDAAPDGSDDAGSDGGGDGDSGEADLADAPCTPGSKGCACDDKKACSGELLCKGGETCVEAADCPVGTAGCGCDPDKACVDGLYCKEGKTCQKPADCPTGSEGCPCSDKGSCNIGFYCRDGKSCQSIESCPTTASGCPCTQDKGCGTGLFCNGATDQCATADACPKGGLGCPCPTGASCGTDLSCGAASTCVPCKFGTEGCPCAADKKCDASLMCSADKCVPDPCYGKEGQVGCPCKGDGGGCDKDAWCNAGACQVCKADGPGCACGDKQPCASNLTCSAAGACAPCDANLGAVGCKPKAEGGCLDGNTLDEATGLCIACAPGLLGCACTEAKTCSGNYKCKQQDNVCVACAKPEGCPCVAKGDCGAGLLCDGASQACAPCEAGTPGCDCKGSGVAACGDGYTCELGVCETCKPGKLGCPMACNAEFPAPVKVVGKTTCAACEGNCKGAGETGLAVPGQTKNGVCICETKDGYFWEASSAKTEPCDGDGDGWIRQTALDAMRSDDPVVKANARCANVLHRVEYFALVNEKGVALPVDVTTVLAAPVLKAATLEQDGKGGVVLTEPLLFDSENLLSSQVQSGGFPNFNGGRPPKARELNPLTKSCVSAGADFNGNNIADVEEWVGHGKAKQDAISQLSIKFSYWIELHRGWWASVPPPVTLPEGVTSVGDGGQPKAPVGVYFIAEKHRALLAPAPTQVSLVEPTTTSQGYWRQCRRRVATDYKTAIKDGATTIGFDFAQWAHQSPAWGEGMTHHSQFHCAVIAANDAVLSDAEKQFKIRSADLDKKWTVNECKYAAGSHAPLPVSATQVTAFDAQSNAANPQDPVSGGCSVAAPSTGATYWLVSRYLPYIKSDNYTRGCINECIDSIQASCPYILDDPHSMYACLGNNDNSGAAMCACNNGYYGEPAKGCAPKCGDGIIATVNEICDDGNTKTNDGCSDKCECEGWSAPVLETKTGTNGYSYKAGTCQCDADALTPKAELGGKCSAGGTVKATDLGAIGTSGSGLVKEVTTGGRIRFGETEDWFRVYAPDQQQIAAGSAGTDPYELAINLALDTTPGSDAFVMDVFRGPKEDLSCQQALNFCTDKTSHTWKSALSKCYRQVGGAKLPGTSSSGWSTKPSGAVDPPAWTQFSGGGWGNPGSQFACPDYTSYYYIRVKRKAGTATTCGGYKLTVKSLAN